MVNLLSPNGLRLIPPSFHQRRPDSVTLLIALRTAASAVAHLRW